MPRATSCAKLWRRVRLVHGEHGRRLADGHVVEHAERGDDQPREHEPAQVELAEREAGVDGVLGGEPGDARPVDRDERDDDRDDQRTERPDRRRGRHRLSPWLR
jgi:hypothetical protein